MANDGWKWLFMVEQSTVTHDLHIGFQLLGQNANDWLVKIDGWEDRSVTVRHNEHKWSCKITVGEYELAFQAIN